MQRQLTSRKKKSSHVWAFISTSACTKLGKSWEQKSKPGSCCFIQELMYYVKVLRYIVSRPASSWQNFLYRKSQLSQNRKGLIVLHLSIVYGQMAVEKMQGISRLEQFVEALSEEERAKELKQEKKRQKRKNRRKNKCGLDSSEQEALDKEKILDEVILPWSSAPPPLPFVSLRCFTWLVLSAAGFYWICGL